jgi:hypothetical protein
MMVTKKRILRRDDMRPPKLGNLEALSQHLIENLGFSPQEALKVTQLLNVIVPIIVRDMNAYSSAPAPSRDRTNVQSAITSLGKAKRYLERCGFHTRTMLQPLLGPLGEMFSVGWLRQNTAAGRYLPGSKPESSNYDTRRARAAARSRTRSRLIDIEQDSLTDRYYVLRVDGLSVIGEVLATLEEELRSGLRSTQRRGRRENIYRKYFVRQLVDLWKHELRRPTPQTIGSPVGEFCCQVFKSIGWPTAGLDVAVQKEIQSYPRN